MALGSNPGPDITMAVGGKQPPMSTISSLPLPLQIPLSPQYMNLSASLSLSPSHFPIKYLLTRMVPNHLAPQMLGSLWLISAFPGQVTRNELWLSSMHLCLMALGGSTDNFENQIQKKKNTKKTTKLRIC